MEVLFFLYLRLQLDFMFRSFLATYRDGRWKEQLHFEPSWRVICDSCLKTGDFVLLLRAPCFPAVSLHSTSKLTFTKYTGLARVIGGTSHSKVQWQGRMRYKSILRDSVCLVGGCEWDLSSYMTRAGMSPEMVVSRFDIPKLETRLRLPHKAEASTAPHV